VSLSISATVPNRSTKISKAVVSDITKKDVSVLLNDPAMNQKWGLVQNQIGKAWKISQGSKKIKVAIIDTGIDAKHEDLKDNLWVNAGETGFDSLGRDKATNGIDDDGNGFIDDVYGWNFVTNNNDLSDNHGHGTHIAGIIGAVGGNGKGISGVSPEVSLMILKYYDPKGYGEDNLKNTIKAIHYAIDNGAHIINYSGGGLEYSADEKAAIEKARKRGILFIAAAGNERSNSDIKKYYPADYNLDNIISVTAIDNQTRVLPSSNYGVLTVDIGAPGSNIYSTLPDNKYGFMTGTSQATAYVSGVAALVLAHHSDYKPYQVAKYLTNTGDIIDSLKGKTLYNRRLNSYRALSILDSGVGATGVIADNLSSGSLKTSFSSDNSKNQSPNLQAFKGFGESLIKNIGIDSSEVP
jgi:thermitase